MNDISGGLVGSIAIEKILVWGGMCLVLFIIFCYIISLALPKR